MDPAGDRDARLDGGRGRGLHQPRPAADDDLFEVLDIKVDETDQTAAAAREKALAAGERRAWDVLVQRLVDPAAATAAGVLATGNRRRGQGLLGHRRENVAGPLHRYPQL